MKKGNVILNEGQKKLIQRVGVSFEQTGMAPAEARILALLLVSTETELTFDQIQDVLKLSKSAVSNAINKLLVTQDIEYITHLGDRKRYFKIRTEKWQESIKESLVRLSLQSQLFRDILDFRPKSTKEFNKSLADIIDYIDYVRGSMQTAFQKWSSKNEK